MKNFKIKDIEIYLDPNFWLKHHTEVDIKVAFEKINEILQHNIYYKEIYLLDLINTIVFIRDINDGLNNSVLARKIISIIGNYFQHIDEILISMFPIFGSWSDLNYLLRDLKNKENKKELIETIYQYLVTNFQLDLKSLESGDFKNISNLANHIIRERRSLDKELGFAKKFSRLNYPHIYQKSPSNALKELRRDQLLLKQKLCIFGEHSSNLLSLEKDLTTNQFQLNLLKNTKKYIDFNIFFKNTFRNLFTKNNITSVKTDYKININKEENTIKNKNTYIKEDSPVNDKYRNKYSNSKLDPVKMNSYKWESNNNVFENKWNGVSNYNSVIGHNIEGFNINDIQKNNHLVETYDLDIYNYVDSLVDFDSPKLINDIKNIYKPLNLNDDLLLPLKLPPPIKNINNIFTNTLDIIKPYEPRQTYIDPIKKSLYDNSFSNIPSQSLGISILNIIKNKEIDGLDKPNKIIPHHTDSLSGLYVSKKDNNLINKSTKIIDITNNNDVVFKSCSIVKPDLKILPISFKNIDTSKIEPLFSNKEIKDESNSNVITLNIEKVRTDKKEESLKNNNNNINTSKISKFISILDNVPNMSDKKDNLKNSFEKLKQNSKENNIGKKDQEIDIPNKEPIQEIEEDFVIVDDYYFIQE